ncbi:MAG: hypothetical protein K5905_21895, partial [Roseibium sp.]|uniref:hypothetical protein n=1 Tax=Roseibium sp. TaxID=1936156 RepID=UPI0026331F7A
MRSVIIASATTPEDVKFLKAYETHSSHKLLVLCTNFLSWALSKKIGLLALRPPKKLSDAPIHRAQSGFSTISKRLSIADANYAEYGAYKQLCSIDEQIIYAIIPSGRHAHQVGLSRFCLEQKVPMIFLGYGNIAGKTVVDPWGTDADAHFYHRPKQSISWLKQNSANPSAQVFDVDQTILEIQDRIRQRVKLPQSKSKYYAFQKDALFTIDWIAQMLTNRISDRRPYPGE